MFPKSHWTGYAKIRSRRRHSARNLGYAQHPLAQRELRVEHLETRQLLTASASEIEPQHLASFGQLPLSFEANQGQTDSQVQYVSRGDGYALFLTPQSAVISLQDSPSGGDPDSPQLAAGAVVAMNLVGANPSAAASGQDLQAGISNYFIGDDADKWHTDVAHYGRIAYDEIYPGIDLVYYGNQRQLEYDFIVAPGVNPANIRFQIDGASSITLNDAGDLVLHTPLGDVLHHAPIIYQDAGGVRQSVEGRFVLSADNQVHFDVGVYDASLPLTIDPVLTYSTYLGGSSLDELYGVTIDAQGNYYVVGQSSSTNFPTVGPFQASRAGTIDVVVAKLNADGTSLLYSTYLGGTLNEKGNDLVVDSSGNAYLTGNTNSTNFPKANAIQTSLSGGQDIFVAKLNSTGSALVYSTYLGGSGTENGAKIAIDSSSNIYVHGWTTSSNFPTANALQPSTGGGGDAVLVKLNASGSALVYSTYLGGSGTDAGSGVAVDSSGAVYLTGATTSFNFPTVNPLQASSLGSTNSFVAKVNPAGTALQFSTYLGGNVVDNAQDIAIDSAGNSYIVGQTNSTNFPRVNAAQNTKGGGQDAFVTKVNATGSAILYSTYVGGTNDENGSGIAVDGSGNAYITGHTMSTNFPLANALQSTLGGGTFDAFVTQLSPSGAFLFSSYLGGSSNDFGTEIALDGDRRVVVIGNTTSPNFPLVTPVQSNYGALSDGFIAKISIPTTQATLNAGNLTLIDSSSAGQNDTLTIKSDTTNSNFIITDPNNLLGTSIPGASGSGTHTLTIPFSAVTGPQISILTLAGDDSLTVDYSLGNFSKSVVYDGGTQTTADSLTLTGGSFAAVTHTLTNNSAGNVSITGNSLVSYDGVEPMTDSLTAVDRTFTFAGGAETISLTDAAGANMTIDSTLGVGISFSNPAGSLTLNAGTGDDTLTVSSVDAAFAAALTIRGDANNDLVNLNASVNAGANAISVVSEQIKLGGNLTTNGGAIALSGKVIVPSNVTVDTNSDNIGPPGAFSLQPGNDLEFAFTGNITGTQYPQLDVHGAVDLTNINLVLTGNYSPLPGQPFTIIKNDLADPVVGTFNGLPEGTVIGGSRRITYQGGSDNDVVLNDIPLQVISITPTATGFTTEFNHPVNLSPLNLYGVAGPSGVADVTLVNAAQEEVRGSIVFDASGRRFTFIKSGDVLPTGNYSILIRSGSGGFASIYGDQLDGNSNGVAGDDYTGGVTVAAPAPQTVTLSVSDFARGYGQAVNLPASGNTGLPIILSDATGAVGVDFVLRYNPALLHISGVSLAPGIAGSLVYNNQTAGTLTVSITNSAALTLQTGPVSLINISADVPSGAAYGAMHVLDLTSVHVTGLGQSNEIPSLDNDGIHIAAFFGDGNGNQQYNSPDSTVTQRLIVGSYTGLLAYPLTDPNLIVDITGNGLVQSDDVTWIQRAIVGLSTPNIPALPNSSPMSSSFSAISANSSPSMSAQNGDDADGFITTLAGVRLSATEHRQLVDSAFSDSEDFVAELV